MPKATNPIFLRMVLALTPTNLMYKYTRINYCNTAPSLGGGSGVETTICFSRSPKLATSLRGTVISEMRGNCECPQLTWTRFERDGKLIFEGWED